MIFGSIGNFDNSVDRQFIGIFLCCTVVKYNSHHYKIQLLFMRGEEKLEWRMSHMTSTYLTNSPDLAVVFRNLLVWDGMGTVRSLLPPFRAASQPASQAVSQSM